MRAEPRLVGRRLQTEAVKAGNGCSGSPKRSRLSGCTWYWRSGVSRDGSLLAKQPSWLGAMVNGPRRNSAYSRPMATRPPRRLARSLSVAMSFTL